MLSGLVLPCGAVWERNYKNMTGLEPKIEAVHTLVGEVPKIFPGFGVEPGAGEAPPEIVVSEQDKVSLRDYLGDLAAAGAVASRRPGSRPQYSIFG